MFAPSTTPTTKEPDMTANKYAEEVVRDFMRNITDHVFLNIQNNERLMREYQTRVNENSLQAVNAAIGKKIRKIFDLKNDGECNTPKSWLIKDFTFHKK
jgi:bisphosphoglycerate-independent phosphoglycerate mutase (AlkP superfamily)